MVDENNVPDKTEAVVPTIQTLNVVPQKVIQVDKPAGYYEDQKKMKIFVYQVYLYWIINAAGFPDNRIKVVFAVFYYRGKALE